MAIYRVPGPCIVWFGTPVPKSLGVSKMGVTIRARTSWSPITDDAHGTEPADYIYAGKAVQVEIPALDVVKLLAANIWGTTGGLLAGSSTALTAIGKLASALGQQLSIVERAAEYTWIAAKAIPLDPDTMLLASTTELQLPVTFLITPDDDGKLFSTFPNYIV